jgi:hypothetical protein
MVRGKRVTVKAKLLSYVRDVMERFALEDEATAVNLIIGSCSQKPVTWLALKPGEAVRAIPNLPALKAATEAVEDYLPSIESSALDELENAISNIESQRTY